MTHPTSASISTSTPLPVRNRAIKDDIPYWCDIQYMDPCTERGNIRGLASGARAFNSLGQDYIYIQQSGNHACMRLITLAFIKQHKVPLIVYREVYATAIENAMMQRRHPLHIETITAWALRVSEFTLHDNTVIKIYKNVKESPYV